MTDTGARRRFVLGMVLAAGAGIVLAVLRAPEWAELVTTAVLALVVVPWVLLPRRPS